MTRLYSELGRRERQIMDCLYHRGRASAAEVLKDLPDPPSYSSVRSMLRLLEDKGYVRHEWDGPRYVYLPAGNREQVQRTAGVRTVCCPTCRRCLRRQLALRRPVPALPPVPVLPPVPALPPVPLLPPVPALPPLPPVPASVRPEPPIPPSRAPATPPSCPGLGSPSSNGA